MLISDYLPEGLSLDDADWTAAGATATYMLAGPIPPGATEEIAITCLVTAESGLVSNSAEISEFKDQDGNILEDFDSIPDDNSENDGPMQDDNITGANGDEDDSDFAEITVLETIPPVFDLALSKLLAAGQAAVVAPGSTVTYELIISNEGEVDAYDIALIDYLPEGFQLQDTDWTLSGDNATILISGPLLAAETMNISITLIAAETEGMHINLAEIAGAKDVDGNEQTDTDSSPANAVQTEDDIDDAELTVELEEVQEFDLSLTKELSSGQSQVVNQGNQISYTFTVFNEGNVTAQNVQVVDYLPEGLSLNDNSWDDTGSVLSNIIPGPIQPGNSVSVDLNLVVEIASGSLINRAEIAAAETDEGLAGIDIDSTADMLPDNDDPGEDDQDEQEITVIEDAIFDLALTKTLAEGQDGNVETNEQVTFELNVYNQGNVDAYEVVITDYIPEGMLLADDEWTASGGMAQMVLPGPIEAGSSATVQITMTVVAGEGDLVNVAEIADAQDAEGNHPVDVDSVSDTDNTNDGPATDDVTDGTNGDEDDSDPAAVSVVEAQVFDLALTKQLAVGQAETVSLGDLVNFTITVLNQGDITAYNVALVDYIPLGLSLSDSDWTTSGSFAFTTLPGPIAAGQSVSVDISMTADIAGAVISNFAEIAMAEAGDGLQIQDADSTPDSDPMNDGMVVDNVTNGINGDEDDSDLAEISVEEQKVYDLALIKTTSELQADPVTPGDEISFNIQVFNQGTAPVYNVEIVDYLPQGLLLNDVNWTADGQMAYQLLEGPIAPGTTANVQIWTILDPLYQGGTISNAAEISLFTDENGIPLSDIDSSPDADAYNDGIVIDDNIDGNGDEDDHDHAVYEVETETPVFDLALMKTLAQGQSEQIHPGDEITFELHVLNQGNLAATQVQLVDYIPEGLLLSDDDWNQSGNMASILLPETLAVGDTYSVQITMTAGEQVGSFENIAEIASALDADGLAVQDIDSNADSDALNDGPMRDDEVAGFEGDEDDSDLARIEVTSLPVFDLALEKLLAPGQNSTVNGGDELTFLIKVFNQGTVDAWNVELIDYLPFGMTLSDSDWTDNGNQTASHVLEGPIVPGGAELVPITFVAHNIDGELINRAEIAAAQDAEANYPLDIDSTPDENPFNDGEMIDGIIDGTSDDEDDSDLAAINVVAEVVNTDTYDLALTKQLAAGQADLVYPGDIVSYELTVWNQGTAPAYNVVLVDYIPVGLELLDSNWELEGSTASYMLTEPIANGSSKTVEILFTVGNLQGELRNLAEIAQLQDAEGNDVPDLDSTADTDSGNDGPMEDDAIDGSNVDEDDSDFALITVGSNEYFDLALEKRLAPGQPENAEQGDEVTYLIKVHNQGTIPAYDVEVIDYLPEGLTLADDDWVDNGDNTASMTIAGPVPPSGAALVPVTFLVGDFDGQVVNLAEIVGAFNVDGILQQDVDSSPDNNPDNDGVVVDGVLDGTDGDEDDSDSAAIFLTPGTGEPTEPTEPIEDKTFDLALVKSLSSTQDSLVVPGDDVFYTIEIFNQGEITAYNVMIVDYIPAAFELLSAHWNMVAGSAITSLPGPIAPGESKTVEIKLSLSSAAGDGELVNFAEIVSAEDENGKVMADVDSQGDVIMDNDGAVKDNAIDGEEQDEDDHDAEAIQIDKNYVETLEADVRLRMSANAIDPMPGDIIVLELTVINEGELDITGLQVTDVLPAELTFVGASLPDYNPDSGLWDIGNLAIEQELTLEIMVEIAASSGSLSNYAQVSWMDQEDADSAPANGNALYPNNYEDDEAQTIIEMGNCTLMYESIVECSADGGSYTVIVSLGHAAGDVYVTGDFEGLVDQTFSIGPKPIGSTYRFVATDSNGCTISEEVTPPSCETVPIELLSFDGHKQHDGNLLSWVSATEVNAAYYTLMRSDDGMNFFEITTMTAAGNSEVANRYDFLDTHTKAGTVYYKLQQTDEDGRSADLGIVSIYREAAKLAIIDIHPSPAHDYVDVAFSYEREGLVDIELYDAAGRLVYERKADAVAGTNNIRINLWQFDAGVYFLMISNEKESTVEKLIKQ